VHLALVVKWGLGFAAGMARKVRLQSAGAVWHVTCREDRHEDISRGEKDRWLFLDTLADASGPERS